jgi:hypothetical protein
MATPRYDEEHVPSRAKSLAITDGEILWSLIQGSILVPGIWNRLLNGYGFCEQHAWTHLSIEMSFREKYLLVPTILYGALIQKSLDALSFAPFVSNSSVARRLRAADTCLLCALNVRGAEMPAAPQTQLYRFRDGSFLRSFACGLRSLWNGHVCSACKGQPREGDVQDLCRLHLLAAAKTQGPIDFLGSKWLLQELDARVNYCLQSFTVGGPEAGDRDWAAVITAIGWCSGWRPLLTLLRQAE